MPNVTQCSFDQEMNTILLGVGRGYITQGQSGPKSNLQFAGGDNWSAMHLSYLHGVWYVLYGTWCHTH